MTQKSPPPSSPKTTKPLAPNLLRPQATTTEPSIPEVESMEAPTQSYSVKELPRFQFFLIDSGWIGPVPELMRQNLGMITHLHNNDPFFILSREQSSELLKKHPHLIGKDPILLARDLHGSKTTGAKEYHGFHLNLGIIKDPEKAMDVLQHFLNFLAVHRKSRSIEAKIRQQLHRDGFVGAIEVLRGGAENLI